MKSVKAEGSVAVLSGGWKFQTVSLNAKDAQLIESRQFNSVDIARWFGVPTSKLGISTGVAYAGIEAEQIAFLTDTLQPLLQKLESEFESKLLTDNERLTTDIRFDITNFLRTDMKSKAEIYRTLFNIGVMTINEIRNELDLQNVAGGDTTYLQVNMTTLNNLNNENTNNENKL
jgi:HK97 family phage portal protein